MTYNTKNWKRENNKDMDYNNSSRRFRPLGSSSSGDWDPQRQKY